MAGGDRFDQVLAHIEANLFERLSVGGLAAVAGLSAFHFSRQFTARIGESVMSHVRRKRMLHAAARLLGDRPPALAELAFDCGFESQEAFTRCFKQVFATTPGRFRRDGDQSQITMERQMPTIATAKPNLVLLDGIKHRDAFTVAGLSMSGRVADSVAAVLTGLAARALPRRTARAAPPRRDR